MFQFVPFESLTGDHLRAIAASINAAPADDQPCAKFIIEQLRNGNYRAFAYESGLVVVSKKANRLVLELMSASIWRRKDLASALRRLAADWECDTVETMVFDPRLADAIVKVGGQVESYIVTLPVGN